MKIFGSEVLIHIREYFQINGALKPTDKGVTLTSDNWAILYALIRKSPNKAIQVKFEPIISDS